MQYFLLRIVIRVWQSGILWHEQLSPEIANIWKQSVNDLLTLQRIRKPRFLGMWHSILCALCAFYDASYFGICSRCACKVNTPVWSSFRLSFDLVVRRQNKNNPIKTFDNITIEVIRCSFVGPLDDPIKKISECRTSNHWCLWVVRFYHCLELVTKSS